MRKEHFLNEITVEEHVEGRTESSQRSEPEQTTGEEEYPVNASVSSAEEILKQCEETLAQIKLVAVSVSLYSERIKALKLLRRNTFNDISRTELESLAVA